MLSRTDKQDGPQATVVPFAIATRALDTRTAAVAVRGELDLSTAPQLKWTLMDALEEGRSGLIVDLSCTTFMDSTALGVLVGVNRSLDAGARMAIVCASPELLRIFELAGMDGAFRICATLDDALAHVSGRIARAG